MMHPVLSALAGCLLACALYRRDQPFWLNWARQICMFVAILLFLKVFA